MVLRKLTGLLRPAPSLPAIPPGERVYAIGDVHGRITPFQRLIQRIEADNAARGRADTWLILLGDLTNYGPDARAVLEQARALTQSDRATVCLLSSHESLVLRCWHGEEAAALPFLKAGGGSTLTSYDSNLASEMLNALAAADIVNLVRDMVPKPDIDFLQKFGSHCVIGDYNFVPETVGPNMLPLSDASGEYLPDNGLCCVHRRDISARPMMQPRQIANTIEGNRTDTISAMGFQGTERWFVTA